MSEEVDDISTHLNVPVSDNYLMATCDNIINLMLRLKIDFHFQQLIDLTAVEQPDGLFHVIYVLRNLNLNKIVFVKVITSEEVQSITNIFSNAEWYECEVYEMFGIKFLNHPNLRRILTDSTDHPLRKLRAENE